MVAILLTALAAPGCAPFPPPGHAGEVTDHLDGARSGPARLALLPVGADLPRRFRQPVHMADVTGAVTSRDEGSVRAHLPCSAAFCCSSASFFAASLSSSSRCASACSFD